MKKLQYSQLLHNFMSLKNHCKYIMNILYMSPSPISPSKPLLRLKLSDIQYTYVCIQG